jgi:hypothetical protein
VIWKLAHGLLNSIVVVVVMDCFVGVVVVVVAVVGDVAGVDDVGDMINVDEAGGAGISVVVMDATV